MQKVARTRQSTWAVDSLSRPARSGRGSPSAGGPLSLQKRWRQRLVAACVSAAELRSLPSSLSPCGWAGPWLKTTLRHFNWDRKRLLKNVSNNWASRGGPDARITWMKHAPLVRRRPVCYDSPHQTRLQRRAVRPFQRQAPWTSPGLPTEIWSAARIGTATSAEAGLRP